MTTKKSKKKRTTKSKYYTIVSWSTPQGIWLIGIEERNKKFRVFQLFYEPTVKRIDIMTLSGWKKSYYDAEDIAHTYIDNIRKKLY